MDQLSDKLALLGLQEEKAGVMREDIGLEEELGHIRYNIQLALPPPRYFWVSSN